MEDEKGQRGAWLGEDNAKMSQGIAGGVCIARTQKGVADLVCLFIAEKSGQ